MATIEPAEAGQNSVYDRLVELVFSGDYQPGAKLIERELAEVLQVSRIPIRESLARMVAQGLLLAGGKREGVRIRKYTPEEVHQLYEFRQFLEVGIARAASRYANAANIERLEQIWAEAQKHVGEYGSRQWAKLDHAFHEALAHASQNRRAIQMLRLLLTECHYLFYLRPSRQRRQLSQDEAVDLMRQVQQEHRMLMDCILAGDAEGAEQTIRKHIVVEKH